MSSDYKIMVAIKSFESAASRTFMIGILLSALWLTGCASHKMRYAEIGCVSARGQLHDGVPSYNEIRITGPTDPTAPRISLKMPNGQVIDRKSLTYVALKKAGFEDVPGDGQQPSSTYDYRLTKYGVLFVFFNGSLVTMDLTKTSGSATSIAVGRERGKKFYNLPLTQQQLEEVFGHPEKVADKFHL